MPVGLLFSGKNGVDKVHFWDQLILATTILSTTVFIPVL